MLLRALVERLLVSNLSTVLPFTHRFSRVADQRNAPHALGSEKCLSVCAIFLPNKDRIIIKSHSDIGQKWRRHPSLRFGSVHVLRVLCFTFYLQNESQSIHSPEMVCSNCRIWFVTFHHMPTYRDSYTLNINDQPTNFISTWILPSFLPLSVHVTFLFSILWIYAEAHSFCFGCKYPVLTTVFAPGIHLKYLFWRLNVVVFLI